MASFNHKKDTGTDITDNSNPYIGADHLTNQLSMLFATWLLITSWCLWSVL